MLEIKFALWVILHAFVICIFFSKLLFGTYHIHHKVKKKVCTFSDLLLKISLAGGQSLNWINHESQCEARMIYLLRTN